MAGKAWAYLLVKPVGDVPVQLHANKSELRTQKHKIGRSPTCDTVLEGYSVISAEHCIISTEFVAKPVPTGPSGFFYLGATLTDNSTNGTIVNGVIYKKGEKCDLQNGAKIEMKGKKIPIYLEFHQDALSEKEIQELKRNMTSNVAQSPSPTKIISIARTPTNEGQNVSAQKLGAPVSQSASLGQTPDSRGPADVELNLLRARVKELENKLLRQELKHQDSEKLYMADLETLRNTMSKLHEETGKTSRELMTVTSARDALEVKLSETKREHELLQREHAGMKAKVVALESSHVQSLNNVHKELSDTKRIREGDLTTLTQELEKERQEVAKLKQEIKASSTTIEQEKIEAEQLRARLTQEQSRNAIKLQEMWQVRSSLEAKLALSQLEKDKLQVTLADKENYVQDLITTIQEANFQQERIICEHEKVVRLLQAREQTFVLKIDEQFANINELLKAKQDLEEQLQQARTQSESFKASLVQAEAALERQKLETVTLSTQRQEELNHLREECSSRQATVLELKAKFSKEREMFEGQIRAMESLEAEQRSQIQKQRGEMERLQSVFDAEKALWQTASAKMEDLTSNLDKVVRASVLEKLSAMKKLSSEASTALRNSSSLNAVTPLSKSTLSKIKNAGVVVPATEPDDDVVEHLGGGKPRGNGFSTPTSSNKRRAETSAEPTSARSVGSKRMALLAGNTQRDDDDDKDDEDNRSHLTEDEEDDAVTLPEITNPKTVYDHGEDAETQNDEELKEEQMQDGSETQRGANLTALSESAHDSSRLNQHQRISDDVDYAVSGSANDLVTQTQASVVHAEALSTTVRDAAAVTQLSEPPQPNNSAKASVSFFEGMD